MKDAYYFSHDTNAKDDPKCVLLIEQLGPEGYGIFWIIIETLRDQPDFKYPLKLLPALARRYNTTGEKLKAVVLSYDLFILENDTFFFSESLNRRMQIFEEKRKKYIEAGRKGGATKRIKQYPINDEAMLEQSLSIAQASKENQSKKNQTSSSPLINSFPPNDNTPRNWPALIRRLNELNIPTEESNYIIQKTEFGAIGSDIWSIFSEIDKGGIKIPSKFILSKLK